MKILSVVGARPNFMKIAPIVKALKRHPGLSHTLVHTGQHYDYEMSQVFFQDLRIPKPDFNLQVGSASHAVQTARIMVEFEKVALKCRPDVVLVPGDVNSTMACAITAVKLGIPVAHIEAGLRSFDRTMPEEINRIVTDSISDLLFTTCKDGDDNLLNEGVNPKKIKMVGNTMIDSLIEALRLSARAHHSDHFGLAAREYCIATIHRPSNVDDPRRLERTIMALGKLSNMLPVILPIHPRTAAKIKKGGLGRIAGRFHALIIADPMGYVDFTSLLSRSRFAVTDSGGIQEETTYLGIPCLTLRDNTERPITVTLGTNKLITSEPERIPIEAAAMLGGKTKKGRIPPKWDGRTAERICEILRNNV